MTSIDVKIRVARLRWFEHIKKKYGCISEEI